MFLESLTRTYLEDSDIDIAQQMGIRRVGREGFRRAHVRGTCILNQIYRLRYTQN